jgi:peptide/nickel transport system ATP-binding protein
MKAICSPILHIKNLSITFKNNQRDQKVLDSLNLTIYEGETLALVGESGSGKSLTGLASMGLITKNSAINIAGEIWFNHKNEKQAIHHLSEKKLQSIRAKQIAMVFQEPMTALNPTMTCGRQLSETIDQHFRLTKSKNKKKCLEHLQEVELKDPRRIYETYPHQLSGGQKQRVMIAIALSCSPKLLIADEPTTALDVTIQKEILSLITQLQKKQKMACLFISHDLELVRSYADRIAVIKQGVLIELKIAKELFSKPVHSYTKALLACRPKPNKILKKLPTVNDFIDKKGFDLSEFYALQEDSIEETKKRRQRYYKTSALLELKNISKRYKTKKLFGKNHEIIALQNLSLSLFKGESLGIVGESGSGKSTLGKCIIQLETQDDGEIIFSKKKIDTLSWKELFDFRKSVQMIFQDPASALNPKIRIGQMLIEIMQVHKIGKSSIERKKIAINLLKKVGLETNHIDRFPHEFSGGQKQRIVIARALALQPKIIICDESVSALDVSVQAQVLNLLNELKEQFSLSYIFISHDLNIVKHFCDRIMVLKDGIIKEEGYPEELFAHPKSAYTKKLIASIPGYR